MKPLVYFVDKDEKDNYVLSKEELNKILEEVYQAGYEDGLRGSKYVTPIRDISTPATPDWWKDGIPGDTMAASGEPLKITY